MGIPHHRGDLRSPLHTRRFSMETEHAVPRSGHVAMAFERDLLVFGGELPDGVSAHAARIVMRFSPRLCTWSELKCAGSPPRGCVAAGSCVVADQRLFVIGGFDPDADIDLDGKGGSGTMFNIDAVAGRGGAPPATSSGSGGGGRGRRSAYTKTLHVLDLRADTYSWRAVSAESAMHAPSARRDATLSWLPASDGGVLLSFGGWDLLDVHNDLRCFTLHSAEWCALPPAVLKEGHSTAATASPPLARRGHTATVVDGALLVHGGCLGLNTYLDDLYRADVSTRAEGCADWTRIEPRGVAPSARAWHTATAAADGKMMLLVGGRDPCTMSWATIRLPFGELGLRPRYAHSATLLEGGLLILHGGKGEDDELLDDTHVIDLHLGVCEERVDGPRGEGDQECRR
jgi:hypothetical protein